MKKILRSTCSNLPYFTFGRIKIDLPQCTIHRKCTINDCFIDKTIFATLPVFKNIVFEIHYGPEGKYIFVENKKVEVGLDKNGSINMQKVIIKYCARVLMEIE